jgi:hypothetical protein
MTRDTDQGPKPLQRRGMDGPPDVIGNQARRRPGDRGDGGPNLSDVEPRLGNEGSASTGQPHFSETGIYEMTDVEGKPVLRHIVWAIRGRIRWWG